MKRQLIALGAACALATVSAGSLQAQAKPPAAKTPGQRVGTGAPTAGQVTMVGCVEFERDYRARMAAGRGGVLGSGVGAADEFVLTNVRPAEVGTGGSKNKKTTDSKVGAGGGVYTLTGAQEKNLKRDIGRQVEIVGTIENAGKASTGATLTDISDLPRIKIDTWHPVDDYCPAK
jgi:hypothetical protein